MIRTCRDAFRTVEGSYIRKEKFKPVFNELGQVKEVISESPVRDADIVRNFLSFFLLARRNICRQKT